jgi:hypothetical protein
MVTASATANVSGFKMEYVMVHLSGPNYYKYVLVFWLTMSACSTSTHNIEKNQSSVGVIEIGPTVTATRPDVQALNSKLTFLDSAIFDRKLSKALTTRHMPVMITPSAEAGMSVNNLPIRLDRWLSAVYDAGGKVETVPTGPRARGLISEAISLVMMFVGQSREQELYAPVTKYDATIYYRQTDGTIERIIFEPKINLPNVARTTDSQ